MAAYSFSEYTNMIVLLGECRGNTRDAARLYSERYPDRRHPSKGTIWRAAFNLRTYGSFRKPSTSSQDMLNRQRELSENVLAAVYANPHTSTEAIARDVGVSQRTVLRVLHKHQYHPYHIHLHQALHGDDWMHRVAFCVTVRGQLENNPAFLRQIMFSDEATFHRDGTVNRHNLHYWARFNPFWLRQDQHQIRWKVNVWAGILEDRVIGPYFLEGNLNGRRYLEFLQNTLSPEVLDLLPLQQLRALWFQQDGAPPHRPLQVRNWLNQEFPGRWIGAFGPIAWPPRSPDLTPMDYFLWGYVKAQVYDAAPMNPQDLKDRIRAAMARVTPQMLQSVRRNLEDRLDACLTADGQHIEHVL